ncbi:MAG TPA: DUF72 domain-containing protein [Steroidobacteraceae bacterium]|nr:DUF72 domain-containing protein [Steroidobacteraceae bacterium]
MAEIRIGVSGWRYTPWRGVFYPRDLPQRLELSYAARKFPTLEINGSFYSLQRPEYYRQWHDATPADFVFALKGSRFITHMKKLRDIDAPLANYFASGVFELRAKLGPILWQFPPNFRYERERMARFFDLLPHDTYGALRLARKRDARMKGRARLAVDARRPLRHAVEIRHESFLDESFLRLLRDHDIALVIAETAKRWPMPLDITSDFLYLRLHGDTELYKSGYSDRALDRWAQRIRAWHRPSSSRPRDVYCYFDNTDVKLRAPVDAQTLMRKLGVTWAKERASGTDRRASGAHLPP